MSWNKWNGPAVKAVVRTAAMQGLQEWGDEVFEESQERVPVSPFAGGGLLRDSGKVETDAAAGVVAISYDSPPGTHLAGWVHERLDVRHPQGSAKYLERPLQESLESGLAKVAAEVHRVLR